MIHGRQCCQIQKVIAFIFWTLNINLKEKWQFRLLVRKKATRMPLLFTTSCSGNPVPWEQECIGKCDLCDIMSFNIIPRNTSLQCEYWQCLWWENGSYADVCSGHDNQDTRLSNIFCDCDLGLLIALLWKHSMFSFQTLNMLLVNEPHWNWF